MADNTVDKTLKLQSYSGETKPAKAAESGQPASELALELKIKNEQIEEERNRSLEQLKVIVQLRESLKQEQAKTAEALKKAAGVEAKPKDMASQETPGLANKIAQLEEEKNKSLELTKIVEQLRGALKQEQAKTAEAAKKAAELEARARNMVAQETSELAKKTAQLEEEKSKSLELTKVIDQLRGVLNQEQAKIAEVSRKITEADAKIKEANMLESRIKEMNETLAKISAIATMGKTG